MHGVHVRSDFPESAIYYHRVGPRDQMQVLRCGGKCPLSHLAPSPYHSVVAKTGLELMM